MIISPGVCGFSLSGVQPCTFPQRASLVALRFLSVVISEAGFFTFVFSLFTAFLTPSRRVSFEQVGAMPFFGYIEDIFILLWLMHILSLLSVYPQLFIYASRGLGLQRLLFDI